ncbi:MAG: hypothetical protein ACR2G3_02345 [Solirubrobacterales bacterium]
MKAPRLSSRGLLLACALASTALLSGSTSAISADGLAKYEIVPGESIGIAALGMTRDSVERRLGNPVDRSKDRERDLYSLVYRYPRRGCPNEPGESLSIVFRGLSRQARAVYMLTLEPCLATRPQRVGVGDTAAELNAAYGGLACYHSNPDGSRDPNVDNNENSKCELRRNGGFTYFSFHSVDADPEQRIGAIAIATRRID